MSGRIVLARTPLSRLLEDTSLVNGEDVNADRVSRWVRTVDAASPASDVSYVTGRESPEADPEPEAEGPSSHHAYPPAQDLAGFFACQNQDEPEQLVGDDCDDDAESTTVMGDDTFDLDDLYVDQRHIEHAEAEIQALRAELAVRQQTCTCQIGNTTLCTHSLNDPSLGNVAFGSLDLENVALPTLRNTVWNHGLEANSGELTEHVDDQVFFFHPLDHGPSWTQSLDDVYLTEDMTQDVFDEMCLE